MAPFSSLVLLIWVFLYLVLSSLVRVCQFFFYLFKEPTLFNWSFVLLLFRWKFPCAQAHMWLCALASAPLGTLGDTRRSLKDVTWYTFVTVPTACHYGMKEPGWERGPEQVMCLAGWLTVRLPSSSLPSFLQPPKPLSSLSTLRDGNWRDGCYWCSFMDPWRMGRHENEGVLPSWLGNRGCWDALPFTLTHARHHVQWTNHQRLTISLTLCLRYRGIPKPAAVSLP